MFSFFLWINTEIIIIKIVVEDFSFNPQISYHCRLKKNVKKQENEAI